MARVPRRLMKQASLDLTAEQLHLLGVIDGLLDEEELSFICGENAATVAKRLDELANEGLVAFARTTGELDIIDEPSAEMLEDSVLAPEQRARIDGIHQKLDKLDHYALLDIDRDAEKKAIKHAYYRMAQEFHPDKFYGREIGGYKKRVEAIFDRLTKAHDTLTNKKRRGDYDKKLGPAPRRPQRQSIPPPQPAARAPADSIPPPPPESVPGTRGRGSGPGVAESSSVPPGRASSPGQAPMPPAQPVPTFQRPPPPTEEQMRAKRDALRKKLLAGNSGVGVRDSSPNALRQSTPNALRQSSSNVLRQSSPGAPPRQSSPGPTAAPQPAPQPAVQSSYRAPEGAPRSAAEVQRERFAKAADEARDRRLRKYVESAEQAMKARDYRTARAAYLQAAKLAPNDGELQVKADLAAKLAGD